jgi:hypothetical protein
LNRAILAFLPAVAAALPRAATGQGTLYVSNLGQTPSDSGAAGSDAWIAQLFLAVPEPGGVAPLIVGLGTLTLLRNHRR